MGHTMATHHRFALLLLFALATVLTVSVAQARQPDEPDPFVESVRRVRASVVAVGTYSRTDRPTIRYFGTGFVIGDGSMIATNHHVADAIRRANREKDMQVFFPDSLPTEGRRATIIGEDEKHDVAILRFDGAKATPLEMNLRLDVEQGMTVGVLGYPIGTALGLVPAAHRGVVAAIVPAVLPLPAGAKLTPELAEARRNPYMLYQLDLTVYPGNSGSPLFDGVDGRVIGIINKTLATRTREHLLEHPSGIAYAVPARWIEQLLREIAAREEAAKGSR